MRQRRNANTHGNGVRAYLLCRSLSFRRMFLAATEVAPAFCCFARAIVDRAGSVSVRFHSGLNSPKRFVCVRRCQLAPISSPAPMK